MLYRTLDTPVGELRLVASETALVSLSFPTDRGAPPPPATAGNSAILDAAARELDEYFRGERRVFTVPLAAEGTLLQRQVWDELRRIPFGERRSYSDIALAVGRPRAVRAIGAANGMNPLGIIVPCHRVIGRDGSLTGYAGGLAAKRWLLEHEARLTPLPLLGLPL